MAGSPIQSVKILGINPDAVTSEDDLDASDALDGNTSDGVETDSWVLNDDEAVWFFENGLLAVGQTPRSWFLLIYSDYAPIAGSFEVNPESDPLVPGEDNGDTVPEPATIAFLLTGAMISFKRKK
jgi:hypothetical protein